MNLSCDRKAETAWLHPPDCVDAVHSLCLYVISDWHRENF